MIPLSQTIRNIFRDNEFTPDALHLDRLFSYVPVFLYGSEQKGMFLHHLLQSFPLVGVGLTKQKLYTMYVYDDEPVVVEDPKTLKYAVYGELYLVPPKIIRALDANFCRGVHFTRTMQPISYQETEHSGVLQPYYSTWAFMYIGIPEAWARYKNPQAVGLTRTTMSHPNWFYRFTKADTKTRADFLPHIL